MARWQPAKKDTLETIVAEVLYNYGHGRTIVAVDGAAAAGTSAFADELAEAFRVAGSNAFRAALADFHAPLAVRQTAPFAPAEAYYERAFDYSLLRRVLVEPFRAGGATGFVLAGFDAQRDRPRESRWTTAGADAVLVIDGLFANRPELAGLWNYAVWLESERDPAGEPGSPPESAAAQELYERTVTPRTRANAIVDNSDPEHPRRRFADSC